MKVSKFKLINNNILLEYIYDNSNLISESYSILINNDEKNRRSFISASASIQSKNAQLGLDQRSSVVSNKNIETNQLIKIDVVETQYARLNLNNFSFMSKKDYGASIPIRYDKLRIHVPVNYTFEGYIGCHVKIHTLDYDNEIEVDLSNYFFNMTDVNQINNLEYNPNPLMYGENNWGKYLEIEFPSPNKVSDQRKNGKAKANTINYNLSNGKGLSKSAPVLVDFHFIKSLKVKTDSVFYILDTKVSMSFPHSPDFEKFGVVVEPSTQGDFFLIYPIFNGSIGEFNQWIEDSIIEGNRYYLEYYIDIYEKNIKTSSQKMVITEDFIEEIEFRPILKYSTTTAIIDVTCNLVDAVDETKTTRKASYGMLQDEVSKYSKYLSKINLKKANREEVHKIKTLNAPNTDGSGTGGVTTDLSIIKSSFSVYSKAYNIIIDDSKTKYKGISWTPNRRAKIDIFPFDNIVAFNTIEPDTIEGFKPLDYSQYKDIKLNIRSDIKKISFNIYNDSDANDKENGVIVFRIKEGKYSAIKKIYQNGYRNFYITGSKKGIETIIYTGTINPWNSIGNMNLLEQQFQNSQSKQILTKEVIENKDNKIIKEVKDVVKSEGSISKSIETSGENYVRKQNSPEKKNISIEEQRRQLQTSLNMKWLPYWKSPINVLQKSYEYQFLKNLTDGINKYYTPGDIRQFAISMNKVGILSNIEVDKNTGRLSLSTQREVDIILGYFKIHDFNPVDVDIINYIKTHSDIKQWINTGMKSSRTGIKSTTYKDLTQGSNTPPDQETYEMIKQLSSFELSENNKKYKKK